MIIEIGEHLAWVMGVFISGYFFYKILKVFAEA